MLPQDNPFQQLGAFIYNSVNLSEDQISRFAAVGGKWVVPVLMQLGSTDDESCRYNRENIDALKLKCAKYGIKVGGWFNGWGKDAKEDAKAVRDFSVLHSLFLVVLDCEFAYQNNTKMADLSTELRLIMPNRRLMVTTNSLNDSVVYNGRRGDVALPTDKSFADLGIRVSPQWYSSPNYGHRSNPWTCADLNMEWLVGPQGNDDNLHDPSRADGRAVPISYVHGVLEVTGLEGSDLAVELAECMVAKKNSKLNMGIQIYTLENTPQSDFDLLAAHRGKLYW